MIIDLFTSYLLNIGEGNYPIVARELSCETYAFIFFIIQKADLQGFIEFNNFFLKEY